MKRKSYFQFRLYNLWSIIKSLVSIALAQYRWKTLCTDKLCGQLSSIPDFFKNLVQKKAAVKLFLWVITPPTHIVGLCVAGPDRFGKQTGTTQFYLVMRAAMKATFFHSALNCILLWGNRHSPAPLWSWFRSCISQISPLSGSCIPDFQSEVY
jgi:hypothetical protein